MDRICIQCTYTIVVYNYINVYTTPPPPVRRRAEHDVYFFTDNNPQLNIYSTLKFFLRQTNKQ